ncbi:MAG TPA: homocysteine methyltransferase, partial [bacterium (Candidatus Stahlbacteria)]|nr:homocysteine methyltransferase [Candidatus Stahlbacteria bacterium]
GTLQDAIIAGDQTLACDLAIREEGDPISIINRKVIPTLNLIGKRYEDGEFFLPQLLTSAQAAKGAIDVLKKRIALSKGKKRGWIILATVAGDIHDLGKNIVKTILESHGFDVCDLGVNVPTPRIIKAVLKHKAKVLGLSALMTTTMGRMVEIIEKLKKRKIKVHIVVGGAPVNEAFAKKIGAYYAPNAITGVKLIKRLLNVS